MSVLAQVPPSVVKPILWALYVGVTIAIIVMVCRKNKTDARKNQKRP